MLFKIYDKLKAITWKHPIIMTVITILIGMASFILEFAELNWFVDSITFVMSISVFWLLLFLLMDFKIEKDFGIQVYENSYTSTLDIIITVVIASFFKAYVSAYVDVNSGIIIGSWIYAVVMIITMYCFIVRNIIKDRGMY